MIRFTKIHGLALVADQGVRTMRGVGVPLAGAMDKLTLRLLNYLLGNEAGAAGVEIMGSASFEARNTCQLIVGPAGGLVRVNGVTKRSGQLILLAKGDQIQVQPSDTGLWTLLAFAGGIEVKGMWGSKSTQLSLASCNPHYGPLKMGQTLHIKKPLSPRISRDTSAANSQINRFCLPGQRWLASHLPIVYFTQGPHWPANGDDGFLATMSPSSNRMGYRFELTKERMACSASDGRSYVTQPGLIQCPPDGKPIVLMADCQTTGGYPRLGVIPEAELWKITLLKPGQTVYFQAISIDQACELNNYMSLLERQYRELSKVS